MSSKEIKNYSGAGILERSEVVTKTFNEACKSKNELKSPFILDLLTNRLVGPDGKKILFIKKFFDYVAMPDDFEQTILKSPEALSAMHRDIVDLITANLRVSVRESRDGQKAYIEKQKNAYFERLKKNSDIWASSIRSFADGKRLASGSTSVAEYGGFMIGIAGSSPVDISSRSGRRIKNVRPNIRIQRQALGQFVHWETDVVAEKKVLGKEVEFTKRIYLNPKSSELVAVFSEIMKLLNNANVLVQGKMIDRSYEFFQQIRSSTQEPIRADAIVLYVTESEAESVLNLILSLYKSKPDIFSGRQTPKIPMQIAPGIAIGDEPKAFGESLTSHRVNLIEMSLQKTKEKLGIKYAEEIPSGRRREAMNTFREIFSEISRREGVNPDNISFNLP